MPVKCKYIYIFFGLWPFLQVTYPSSSLRAITSTLEGGWATGPVQHSGWWLLAVSGGFSRCLPTLSSCHLLQRIKWPQFQALAPLFFFVFFFNYFLFISIGYQCLSIHADTTRTSVWPESRVKARACFKPCSVSWLTLAVYFPQVWGWLSSGCAAALSC